ncbi:MAG: HAD-IB family phosphatase, partial [Christensenellaceae bacterium]|nr:HAD-IB family phosphatase [Christensenellaceae bacterium]
NSFKILIVSASPSFYLNLLMNMLPIDAVISTDLEFINGMYTGKFSTKNCYGIEKPKRIIQYLNKVGIEIDYENSCSYTDSFSDKPMLDMVKNRYIINASSKLKKIFLQANYNVEYKNWK